ncbi:hypothetical protein DSM19430T_08640 [Desulfovibrio psychrotolerans]|uniref:HTH merR-type domain-containing protein n=1 Tax=Desulfovibrio psychrotolerans TaxID=415242 RepID=A0A7J0BR85_9BACT|nr:hypothetical protein DSM19430T_08640 [Desulfovibrio psychrotolerans]
MEEKTYRIGEAAKLLNLKTYVLRFWETEFPQLAPHRTEKGQRLYTEQDVSTLRTIRHLLHERGLTIEGARRILTGQGDPLFAEQAAGDGHPSETSLPGTMQSLYSETLTEAVMAALQRAGQTGAGGYAGAGAGRDAGDDVAHDAVADGVGDEEDFPRDRQAIEAIVARVLASGHGIPPGLGEPARQRAHEAAQPLTVQVAARGDTVRSGGLTGEMKAGIPGEMPGVRTGNVPDVRAGNMPDARTGNMADAMRGERVAGKPETLLPPQPDGCRLVVREAIAELEALREMLKPRQCRGAGADTFF